MRIKSPSFSSFEEIPECSTYWRSLCINATESTVDIGYNEHQVEMSKIRYNRYLLYSETSQLLPFQG